VILLKFNGGRDDWEVSVHEVVSFEMKKKGNQFGRKRFSKRMMSAGLLPTRFVPIAE
jgi:hypothetical protein